MEKDELIKAESVNRDLILQLQEYMNENYQLTQQKISLEQNNSTYITEVQYFSVNALKQKLLYISFVNIFHI